jgi:hypothetical protein
MGLLRALDTLPAPWVSGHRSVSGGRVVLVLALSSFLAFSSAAHRAQWPLLT